MPVEYFDSSEISQLPKYFDALEYSDVSEYFGSIIFFEKIFEFNIILFIAIGNSRTSRRNSIAKKKNQK